MSGKNLCFIINAMLASFFIVTSVQAEKTSYDTNTGTITIPEVQILDDEMVSYRTTMSLTSTQNVFLVVETEEVETTNSEEVTTFSLDKSELYIPIVEIEPLGFIPSVEATFRLESLFPLTFKLTSYSFLEEGSENNNFEDDDSGSDDDSKSSKKGKSDDSSSDDDDSKSGKKDDDSEDDDSKSGKKDDDDDSKSGKKHDDKVTICHNGKTMEISESALDGHSGHGDTLSACNDDDLSDDDSGSNDDNSEDNDSDSKVDVCHEGVVVKTVELPEINIPESITKYVESPGAGIPESMTNYVLDGHLKEVDTCNKGKSNGNGSSTDDYDVYVTPAKDAVDAKDAIDAKNAIGATDAQGVNIIPVEDDDSISEDDSSDDSSLDKVTVCHKGKTMKFSESALPAHLRHGDTVGICDDDSKSGKKDDDDSKSGKKDDDDSKSGKKDDDDSTSGRR